MCDPRRLGDRLRAAGVTFAEVARAAGCSRPLVSMQVSCKTPLTPRVQDAAERLLNQAAAKLLAQAAAILEGQITEGGEAP